MPVLLYFLSVGSFSIDIPTIVSGPQRQVQDKTYFLGLLR